MIRLIFAVAAMAAFLVGAAFLLRPADRCVIPSRLDPGECVLTASQVEELKLLPLRTRMPKP